MYTNQEPETTSISLNPSLKMKVGETKIKEKYPFTAETACRIEKLLLNHVGERGDNEGAVECIIRIIHERDLLLRRAIERDIFHRK